MQKAYKATAAGAGLRFEGVQRAGKSKDGRIAPSRGDPHTTSKVPAAMKSPARVVRVSTGSCC